MKKISLKTFRGGVHPDDGKGLSAGCPLRPIEPGAVLYYPLGQHAGAPAVPIVQPGEQVLRGQKIAEAGGFVSAPVHSGVSGTVRKIQKMRMPGGGTSDCIVTVSYTHLQIQMGRTPGKAGGLYVKKDGFFSGIQISRKRTARKGGRQFSDNHGIFLLSVI